MEGVNLHPVCLWADEFQQPPPHGVHARIGEGEAKNALRQCVCFQQNAPDPRGENLRLTRTRPRDHQHRPVGLVNGDALARIEPLEFPQEGLIVLL